MARFGSNGHGNPLPLHPQERTPLGIPNHACRDPRAADILSGGSIHYSKGQTSEVGVNEPFHKRILQWQVDHPRLTWIIWGSVWAAVLVLLSWPLPSGSMTRQARDNS